MTSADPARRRGYAVTPDGVRIAFEDTGEGDAIVLVHGAGLSRVAWRGLGYTAALNGAGMRVIAIDLRGHGQSDKPTPAERYRTTDMAADLIAVLDQLGIAAAHYLGYSLGARIGFTLLDTRPERVRAFVSLGGTFRATTDGPADVFFPGYREAIAHGGMGEFVDRWGQHRGEKIDPDTALALQRNDPSAMLALFVALEQEPGIPESRLTGMASPALFIAGDQDGPRRSASSRARDLMPHAELIELHDTDHTQTLSNATALLNTIVRFVAPLSTAGA